jgi:hypothetical protein
MTISKRSWLHDDGRVRTDLPDSVHNAAALSKNQIASAHDVAKTCPETHKQRNHPSYKPLIIRNHEI